MNTSPPDTEPDGRSRIARGRLRRRLLTLVGVAGAVAFVAAAAVVFTGNEAGPIRLKVLHGPPGNPFALTYPSSWHPRPEGIEPTNKRIPPALAALARKDQTFASLTVRRAGELQYSFDEFRLVSTKSLATKSGRVLVYTLLGKVGVMHVLAIVPGQKHTYVVDAIYTPRATEAGDDITAILKSFTAD